MITLRAPSWWAWPWWRLSREYRDEGVRGWRKQPEMWSGLVLKICQGWFNFDAMQWVSCLVHNVESITLVDCYCPTLHYICKIKWTEDCLILRGHGEQIGCDAVYSDCTCSAWCVPCCSKGDISERVRIYLWCHGSQDFEAVVSPAAIIYCSCCLNQ